LPRAEELLVLPTGYCVAWCTFQPSGNGLVSVVQATTVSHIGLQKETDATIFVDIILVAVCAEFTQRPFETTQLSPFCSQGGKFFSHSVNGVGGSTATCAKCSSYSQNSPKNGSSRDHTTWHHHPIMLISPVDIVNKNTFVRLPAMDFRPGAASPTEVLAPQSTDQKAASLQGYVKYVPDS
jgi:hypothetical protein